MRSVLTLIRCAWSLIAIACVSATITAPAQEGSKASAAAADFVEVVAEGAGGTPAEALKDAFRNAVRQVVGAVVDAETVVKNDEVIDDQVLTYSDGLIKKFTEVAGSKKQQGGVHRIKIRASVERRSVVAKLKAAKVTLRALDGQSLVAEIVSTGEAEENSTKLLAKALSDLPKVLSATVSRKPEYDAAKSEVVLNVEIEPDAAAYRTFVERLQPVLQKISLAKDTVLIKAGPAQDSHHGGTFPGMFESLTQTGLIGPKITPDKRKSWALWVCTSSTGKHSSLRWNGFVVDADIQQAVFPLMNPNNHGRSDPVRSSDSKMVVHLAMQDADGNIVAEDEFELVAGADSSQPDEGHGSASRLPWLAAIAIRERVRPAIFDIDITPYWGDLSKVVAAQTESALKDYVPNVYIAPYALSFRSDGSGVHLRYRPQQTYQRRVKLSLDELRLVKEVKCSVIYTP